MHMPRGARHRSPQCTQITYILDNACYRCTMPGNENVTLWMPEEGVYLQSGDKLTVYPRTQKIEMKALSLFMLKYAT
jgi:hypothetical protein